MTLNNVPIDICKMLVALTICVFRTVPRSPMLPQKLFYRRFLLETMVNIDMS